jgi:hypothetical protein
MHHLNGKLPGGTRIDQDTIFNGVIDGHAYVAGWATVHLNGTIHGDLILEKGAVVDINGTVRGTVINQGAEVCVRGHVESISDTGDTVTNIASNAVIGL